MSINKIWAAGAAIVIVAILALGWFAGVSPKLQESAASKLELESVETQNSLQEITLAKIKSDFAELDSLKAELATLRGALPAGDDLSTFIGELHALEAASGIVLSSIGATEGVPFVPAPAPVVEETDVEADAAETAEPPAPSIPEGQFIVIGMDLSVKGTHEQVLAFVDALQNGNRLFLVSNLNVQLDETTQQYTGGITGFVYVLLDPVAEAAKAEAAATEAAGTAATGADAATTP